jgi:hypothetical protein
MKKVLDGKMYNTETAEMVASWDNGYSNSDFRCCNETLYRTKKGTFFLHGGGGAMTSWSSSYGDMSGWGEDIRPLTDDEAKEWLEGHDKVDALERLFEVAEA